MKSIILVLHVIFTKRMINSNMIMSYGDLQIKEASLTDLVPMRLMQSISLPFFLIISIAFSCPCALETSTLQQYNHNHVKVFIQTTFSEAYDHYKSFTLTHICYYMLLNIPRKFVCKCFAADFRK